MVRESPCLSLGDTLAQVQLDQEIRVDLRLPVILRIMTLHRILLLPRSPRRIHIYGRTNRARALHHGSPCLCEACLDRLLSPGKNQSHPSQLRGRDPLESVIHLRPTASLVREPHCHRFKVRPRPTPVIHSTTGLLFPCLLQSRLSVVIQNKM